MDIIIRDFKPEDTKSVIDLFNENFSHKATYHNIETSKSKKIIVATFNELIIAMAEIDILENCLTNTKYLLINNVCVKNEFKNQKIGSKIMKKIDEIAYNEKCNYITLSSNKTRIIAHKLYKNNGYQIIDTCLFKKII